MIIKHEPQLREISTVFFFKQKHAEQTALAYIIAAVISINLKKNTHVLIVLFVTNIFLIFLQQLILYQ